MYYRGEKLLEICGEDTSFSSFKVNILFIWRSVQFLMFCGIPEGKYMKIYTVCIRCGVQNFSGTFS